MGRKSQYTRNELLKILKEEYELNGKIIQSYFCNKNKLPCYQTYIKEFGSWNNAKLEIGICETELTIRNVLSRKQLIQKFKSIVEKIEHIPTYNELLNLKFPCHQIYKYFDSYEEFTECCGTISSKTSNGKYKNDFLISEIKRFVEEFDKIPNSTDFDNLKGYPSRKTFTNHFNNFNEAIMLAGFNPTHLSLTERKEKYTKEFLLSEIYRFINEFEHVPPQLHQHPNHLHSTNKISYFYLPPD